MKTKYRLYKGTNAKWGAICFDHPYLGEEQKPGVLFVEAASATGNNVYDWSKKVTIALSLGDVGKILHFMVGGAGDKVSIYHDPKKGTEQEGQTQKTMTFWSKEGPLKGAIITVTQKDKEGKREHKVPISGDEIVVLKILLERAVKIMMRWTSNESRS